MKSSCSTSSACLTSERPESANSITAGLCGIELSGSVRPALAVKKTGMQHYGGFVSEGGLCKKAREIDSPFQGESGRQAVG